MRTRAIALTAAIATALGSCSMDSSDGDSTQSESSDSSQSAETSASATSGGDNQDNGAVEAGFDPGNPPKAIARTTMKTDFQNVESTTIELLELRRDENVMLATFGVTGQGKGTETESVFTLLGNHPFMPVFIDMDNMEKYTSVQELTSDLVQVQAPLGEPTYVFTAFPLPRDGVSTMDLQATPGAPVIEDVPMPK